MTLVSHQAVPLGAPVHLQRLRQVPGFRLWGPGNTPGRLEEQGRIWVKGELQVRSAGHERCAGTRDRDRTPSSASYQSG